MSSSTATGAFFRSAEEREAASHRLALWNAGVHLLLTGLRSELDRRLEARGGHVQVREFDPLTLDEFLELVAGHPVRLRQVWMLRLTAPGLPPLERLASAGVLGSTLRDHLAGAPGRPALLWSARHPRGYPPWVPLGKASPGGEQMTVQGDRWLVARGGQVHEIAPAELAARIAEDFGPESGRP